MYFSNCKKWEINGKKDNLNTQLCATCPFLISDNTLY